MERGTGRGNKQLFFQVTDMIADSVILNILHIITPYMPVYLRVSHYLATVGSKKTQDVKLLCCRLISRRSLKIFLRSKYISSPGSCNADSVRSSYFLKSGCLSITSITSLKISISPSLNSNTSMRPILSPLLSLNSFIHSAKKVRQNITF